MTIRKIIYIAVLLIFSPYGNACSCFGPNTFLESLSTSIIELQYLGNDTLMQKGYNEQLLPKSLKKFIVIKVWRLANFENPKKLKVQDTVYYLEGDGANCLGQIKDAQVGRNYLFSLDLSPFQNNFALKFPFCENLIFTTNLCSEPILWLDDKHAKGHILKNKSEENRAFAERFSDLANRFHHKSNQFKPDSFAWNYYLFWSQLGEKGYNMLLSQEPYYEQGQTWSREKLKKHISKRLAET